MSGVWRGRGIGQQRPVESTGRGSAIVGRGQPPSHSRDSATSGNFRGWGPPHDYQNVPAAGRGTDPRGPSVPSQSGHVSGGQAGNFSTSFRGRGRGRRSDDGTGRGPGAPRGLKYKYDVVESRQKDAKTGERKPKQAPVNDGSIAISVQSNYFPIITKTDWALYHYRVDFKPDETDTRIKKKLFKVHGPSLSPFIFDGSSLYMAHRISPDPLLLYSQRETGQEPVELSIRLVAELAPTDPMVIQVFNIMLRTCQEHLGMDEMGRHYFDSSGAIKIPVHRLELWPGIIASMRNHENSILLCVDITHKVLRQDNCLQYINDFLKRKDRDAVKNELMGTVVMTSYNKKTYRIDDIDWSKNPQHTFDMSGKQVSYIQYFNDKYGRQIRDTRQPLLISRPRKRDLHRGMTNDVMLIPELCQMTGFTDEMRNNHTLMRALATHLHTDPVKRVENLAKFMRRLKGSEQCQEELRRWGLRFDDRMVQFKARRIAPETIKFANGHTEMPNDRYDWSNAFRNKSMLTSIPLQTWALIVTDRDAVCVDILVNMMQRVSRPLGIRMDRPIEVQRIQDKRPSDYAKAIDKVMNQYRDRMQMIFAILPRQQSDIYTVIKQRTLIQFGVPSQCFVAKNANDDRKLMSICTKMVIQMNAKLGGEPWSVHLPLPRAMIVGFDVYHSAKGRGNSVGAMVATTSKTHTKFYAAASIHSAREELSEMMFANFTKCLYAYQKINQTLPTSIIFYRDGVGEGQLSYVYETEVKRIQDALTSVYTGAGLPTAKLTFIVVTKRINTRIFEMMGNRPTNPAPGTVADDVITLPERYDFYLVAQNARQGTVSPVSYNVLSDNGGLDPDKMQRLTFKLCHLYFNWSGTVAVPAPCQYAHKLAYLTGLFLKEPGHERLANLLYYL